jgi:hypothetical protein
MSDAEIAVRELVVREVSAGFSSDSEIVDDAMEMVGDEHPGHDLRRVVRRIVAEEAKRHAGDVATWPEVTDCDRLDRAFAALESSGIVARQNFTCCQTCGVAEIGDELRRGSRGYAFFHQQDTAAAVGGGGLFLAFAATAESESAQLAIGSEVVAALTAAGLSPQWNGDAAQRIAVPFDWKRRRETHLLARVTRLAGSGRMSK